MSETSSPRIVRTQRFARAYRKLDGRYRGLVKKALAQFFADPAYPGLRVKRIQGTDDLWEMRAGRDIRITFERRRDPEDGRPLLVLRNVGHHDATLRRP